MITIKMIKFTFYLILFLLAYLKFANLASLLPMGQQDSSTVRPLKLHQNRISPSMVTTPGINNNPDYNSSPRTQPVGASNNQSTTGPSDTQASTVKSSPQTPAPTTTTLDPNIDPDELPSTSINGLPGGGANTVPPPNGGPSKDGPSSDDKMGNKTGFPSAPQMAIDGNVELSVLVYSIFIVYVSFTKLIYHNVGFIKRNLSEPG